MLAIATQGKGCRRHGFNRPQPIAFNARHLHQPARWITGHAQMMFQRDFSGVFDLFIIAAQRRAKAPPPPWRRLTPLHPDSQLQPR